MTEKDPSVEQISASLRERVRVGQGLSVPYAREWDVGGCTPKNSLRESPHDALRSFCSVLIAHVEASDAEAINRAAAATVAEITKASS